MFFNVKGNNVGHHQPKTKIPSSRPQMLCPHCQAANLKIRSSEPKHPFLKVIWLQCPNHFCGFTCGGNIEITHTVSPSAMPNPDVQLPTLKQIQELKSAEVIGKEAANDA